MIFHENSPKNRWKLINQKIGIVGQMLAQLPWKHRKVLFSVFFSHLMLSIFMIHIPFMTSMLYTSVWELKEIIQNSCHWNGKKNFKMYLLSVVKGYKAKYMYRKNPYPNYFWRGFLQNSDDVLRVWETFVTFLCYSRLTLVLDKFNTYIYILGFCLKLFGKQRRCVQSLSSHFFVIFFVDNLEKIADVFHSLWSVIICKYSKYL